MTYNEAVRILRAQEQAVRKVDGTKFILGNYEYRLVYEGGFAAFVRIDRREIGKRNFRYFSGIGAYDCSSAPQVLDEAKKDIEKHIRR